MNSPPNMGMAVVSYLALELLRELELMQRRCSALRKGQPFFLWLGSTIPSFLAATLPKHINYVTFQGKFFFFFLNAQCFIVFYLWLARMYFFLLDILNLYNEVKRELIQSEFSHPPSCVEWWTLKNKRHFKSQKKSILFLLRQNKQWHHFSR